jgi:hypothetical protein
MFEGKYYKVSTVLYLLGEIDGYTDTTYPGLKAQLG